MKDLNMESGDLTISGGDFKIVDSDAQHIDHALKSFKGQFYQFPKIGAGLGSFVNATGQNLVIKKAIREQLKLLGYRSDYVKFTTSVTGELEINIGASTRD